MLVKFYQSRLEGAENQQAQILSLIGILETSNPLTGYLRPQLQEALLGTIRSHLEGYS